jgi:YD repeat-containing protein
VAGQALISYTYDNANRLIGVSQGSSNVTLIHDNAGRRTSLTLPNGTSARYTYDSASHLVGLTYQNVSGPLGDLSYSYDQNGRIVQVGGSFSRTSVNAGAKIDRITPRKRGDAAEGN